MTSGSFASISSSELLLPFLLALPVAALVVLVKPTVIVMLVLGLLLLAVTFTSPLTGLYVLVFSMLLGPEFLVGGMGPGTTLGRGVSLRLDDFILVLVGIGWLAKIAVSREKVTLTRTPLNSVIMFYVVACVFGTLIGIMAERVRPTGGLFFLLKYYEYFFLYFMAVNLVKTENQVRTMVVCTLVTCFLVSLYALSQIPSGVRVSAPFEGTEGEPNTLGGYLLFMMAIVTGLLLTPNSVPQKRLLIMVLLVAAVAFQATLSRASFLAAAVVAFAVVTFVSRRSPLVLALLLTGVVSLPFWAPPAVTERVMYTFTQPTEEGQIQIGRVKVDTSTSDRLRSFRTALDHFYKSPIWGVGVTGGPFMDAMYPRVLMETGVLGLMAFLALLWGVFRMAKTVYRESHEAFGRGLALGFLFGFLGLLVHAVGSNTFIIVRIMEPFWLYAALVATSGLLVAKHQSTTTDVTTQPVGSTTRPIEPAYGAARIARLVNVSRTPQSS